MHGGVHARRACAHTNIAPLRPAPEGCVCVRGWAVGVMAGKSRQKGTGIRREALRFASAHSCSTRMRAHPARERARSQTIAADRLGEVKFSQ